MAYCDINFVHTQLTKLNFAIVLLQNILLKCKMEAFHTKNCYKIVYPYVHHNNQTIYSKTNKTISIYAILHNVYKKCHIKSYLSVICVALSLCKYSNGISY